MYIASTLRTCSRLNIIEWNSAARTPSSQRWQIYLLRGSLPPFAGLATSLPYVLNSGEGNNA